MKHRALYSLAYDVGIAFLAYVLAVLLQADLSVPAAGRLGMLRGAGVFTLAAGLCFHLTGLHKGVWRYASLSDLGLIVRAASGTVAIFAAVMLLTSGLPGLPWSFPIVAWLVLTATLAASRMVYRAFKDRDGRQAGASSGEGREPVLLLGTGAAADLFIRATLARRSCPYRVAGIIDEKGRRVGRSIHGAGILGTLDDLEAVVARLDGRGERPCRLVLTAGAEHLEAETAFGLAERAERLGLGIFRLPDITEMNGATAAVTELRAVRIEDLLGRPQRFLDQEAIGALIGGKCVLLTGAGGSIGSEIARQVLRRGPRRLVLVDSSEFNLYSIEMDVRMLCPGADCRPVVGDVRDRAGMLRLFRQEAPDLVFHAAALKHVPMVELNSCQGVLTNAVGTRNVADAASAAGVAAMVLISTDKAVRPTNIMGASKRVAESYCQALDLSRHAGAGPATKFMTVRFGNVLGSTGSVVPLFERQIAAGGPVTVTHPDITRYFMTIREAVELVLQASAHGLARDDMRGRIFVLDMGSPMKILDLAHRMIRLSGLRPGRDIEVAFTGLRLGEKLYEELFDPSEAPLPTDAPGVLSASPRAADIAILRRSFAELEEAASSGDEGRVRDLVAHLVPEARLEPAPALHPRLGAEAGAP